MTVKDCQRLSKTVKDWQGLARTGKDWQGLSKTGKMEIQMDIVCRKIELKLKKVEKALQTNVQKNVLKDIDNSRVALRLIN